MKLVIKNNKQKFHPITNKGIWQLQAHIQNFMGTSRHMHNNFEKNKQKKKQWNYEDGFHWNYFQSERTQIPLINMLKENSLHLRQHPKI